MEEQKQSSEKSTQTANKNNNESKTFFGSVLRTIIFICVVVITFILCMAYYNIDSYGAIVFAAIAIFGFPIIVIMAIALNFTKSISKTHALIVEAVLFIAIIFILYFLR